MVRAGYCDNELALRDATVKGAQLVDLKFNPKAGRTVDGKWQLARCGEAEKLR
jgi:hypothetical protein